MKRTFINFNYDAAAPEGGGGGAADTPEKQKEALLKSIKDKVEETLTKRNYTNADGVKKVFDTALEGISLDALRSFKFDEVDASVKNMAAAIEKLQNQGPVGEQHRNAIRAMVADKDIMTKIERAFDKASGQTVTLNTRAAVAVMTTGNVVVDGDIPEDILNSFSVDGFIKKRRPMEYLFDLVSRRTVSNITEYKTWLEEGDEQGAFALVLEGAVKPLVSKTLVRNTHKYRKIAGKRVYTEEFAKFRKEAYAILEDLFNDQLMRNYIAILTIDMLAAASAYVGTALDNQFAAPTDYHAIGAAAAQVESLDFNPDVLFLNPQDKWRIGLSQNSQGTFFTAIPVYNPSGEVTMMGFRLITSNRIPVGNFILGEAKLYKVEDEPVTVRLGYGINVTKDNDGFVTDVSSDVDNNRFRIIAETYFHNYIGTNHTGSFIYGNFADIKAALLV